MEVLNNLRSADWLVLVCRGGAAVALALARMGKPLLVVEADPDQVEELQRLLAEEADSAPTVFCELLGSESGETCWYRYNDPRQNGTTGLEALQAHFPNLRLQSLEPRSLRRLDAVLTAWQEFVHKAGDGPLGGAGALVAMGVEALPLLQGGGSWLERFSQLLVPPPLLTAEGDIDAWPALLRGHCLQPAASNPLPKGGEALILLEQDRARLLEQRLQQAFARISNIEAERDGLLAARDDLAAKQQELTAQRDGLTIEREALITERDGLHSILEGLKEALKTSNSQLSSFKKIFSGLVIAQQEFRHDK